jgi:hypothetical protein
VRFPGKVKKLFSRDGTWCQRSSGFLMSHEMSSLRSVRWLQVRCHLEGKGLEFEGCRATQLWPLQIRCSSGRDQFATLGHDGCFLLWALAACPRLPVLVVLVSPGICLILLALQPPGTLLHYFLCPASSWYNPGHPVWHTLPASHSWRSHCSQVTCRSGVCVCLGWNFIFSEWVQWSQSEQMLE